MALVDDELKAFGEQRPGIEPVPFLANLSGNPQLGLSLLEDSPTSRALPRRK
jgi:hypothetical protein